MKLKCIQSLYKSTYKRNAFSKNKIYTVTNENSDFLYVIDNENQEFSISKFPHHLQSPPNSFYFLEDYFKEYIKKIKQNHEII